MHTAQTHVSAARGPAAPAAPLELVGVFPASGAFGSPDGVGGQAAVTGSSPCRLAIGDQGGRLYRLDLEC